MKLTIIEGPDGAGKSELAAALKRYYNDRGEAAMVVHHGPYPGEEKIAHRYLDSFYGPASAAHVVLDRSWLSEPIYGDLLRDGERRVTPAQARMLERAAWARQAAIIVCLPRWSTVHHNAGSRAKDAYVMERLRAVYERYSALYHAPAKPLPMFVYDYEENYDLDAFMLVVDRGRPASNGGPGVGRWAPGEVALLVGERCSAADGPGALPFISWRGGASCGDWLTAQLEAAGVPEARLYWANALDNNGVWAPHGWVHALNPRKVFLMGAAAVTWRRFIHEALPTTAFAHPQYWRRFHAHEPYPLIAAVKEALS